jgi:hypothetical protein
METGDPLLRMCALLNAHGVKYFIVGARACILHGHVRATEDVDVLVEDSVDNFQRTICIAPILARKRLVVACATSDQLAAQLDCFRKRRSRAKREA